uniref:cytochrome P450 704C1-like isoform X1 n=1 Tax=Fragaria vesca subsp. vesca TaxID=101020 RepID=UPI0005C7F6AF|nr:PREDICTED: cytochrome P450 704C1-like isoform X1 [Fragaria vesca subsp. vesca]
MMQNKLGQIYGSTKMLFQQTASWVKKKKRHRNERLCEKKTRYHPVAGTALNQLIKFPRLHHYMTELACKYTTYRLLHLSRSAVYTVDPANVEYMLKTNFANYGKGLYLHSILSDVLGDGIFAVDGAKWRHQRKALSSEFSSKMLRDFSSAVFKLGAVKLARVIATCDQAIDIQDLLMKSSLDSIVKILLGIELDSLCGTNEEGNRFSNAFDQANETALLRIIDIFWKIKRFLNIGREAALKENSIVIDQFVYNLIKSKIGIIHHLEDKQSLITKRDFVSRLLELNETDPKYLRDMVLSFLVAGKDSLAVTPSWFLYMMCKHLHIQEKIAQEVREVINLKDHSSVDELAASLTDEALKKMQYLHAALAETIRLYPAVPMDAKMCFSDDTWPDGFSIRKGDMVIYQPYAMGRMKFLWGDDAEEFRPERWLDKNGQFQDESPFKFTAFQAGPRICPGQEHAYMYMKIFAAVLLGSYMFKLADEKKVVNYKTMVSLQIDGGLYLHAFPRLRNESKTLNPML